MTKSSIRNCLSLRKAKQSPSINGQYLNTIRQKYNLGLPAERFMGRQLNTKLPASQEPLKPKYEIEQTMKDLEKLRECQFQYKQSERVRAETNSDNVIENP